MTAPAPTLLCERLDEDDDRELLDEPERDVDGRDVECVVGRAVGHVAVPVDATPGVAEVEGMGYLEVEGSGHFDVEGMGRW